MTTPPPPRRGGPTLPGFRGPGDSRTVWFSRNGCVVWRADGTKSVLVGGTLIGGYSKGDTASRNLLQVMLAKEEVVLEDLAHAFGLTSEAVRLIRRAFEEGGYAAVVKRKRGGQGPWKVTGKVLRAATLMHDSLGKLLLPLGALLRLALGGGQRILLAFDRAASYAEVLAELRDANFEFVAYEKKPYPAVPKRCFQKSFVLDGERVAWFETRKNLGQERGRLMRIALRVKGGHQVNLLTNSQAPAADLAAIMASRWNQENAFRHGVERWGLNQLDGRTFSDFEADTVIPSPLRRRLENSLAVLREVEGRLRRNLARPARDELRVELERDLALNLVQQQRHEARRPELPTHCTVEEAGLLGKLKRHDDEYKAVIDTIRTVCINAEADLAAELAAGMARPREAKRLLQNFFCAPGDVLVREGSIEVRLDVAARNDERRALRRLCGVATRWKLTLPGDPKARPLRFGTQN